MRNALLRVMTSFRHGGFTQLGGFAIERSRNIKWETLWVACRATFECCCFTCRGEVRPCVSTINYTPTYQMCTSDALWTEPACNSESSEKPNRTCLRVWLMQTINNASSVSDYTVSVELSLWVFPLFGRAQAAWRPAEESQLCLQPVSPSEQLRCKGPGGSVGAALEPPNYVYDRVIRRKCQGK